MHSEGALASGAMGAAARCAGVLRSPGGAPGPCGVLAEGGIISGGGREVGEHGSQPGREGRRTLLLLLCACKPLCHPFMAQIKS